MLQVQLNPIIGKTITLGYFAKLRIVHIPFYETLNRLGSLVEPRLLSNCHMGLKCR